MRFTITPSPSEEVVLTAYDKNAYPKFAQLFEPMDESSRLRLLAIDPKQAATAIVVENRSARAITGLRFRWEIRDISGRNSRSILVTDSYASEPVKPVTEPHSLLLVTQSGYLEEGLIERVRAGTGGLIAARIGDGHRPSAEATDVVFQIDLLLFADGEISGPDPDKYVQELRCRKPAADFVIKQIRMAKAEGRDANPVLSALVEAPSLGRVGSPQGDPYVHWTKRFARSCLQHMKGSNETDRLEGYLRYLENHTAPPTFFRREVSPH